ncbi:MAG: DUF4919 domain-containing protein [Terriglobales bacterium]|jgi:hypothetical protein
MQIRYFILALLICALPLLAHDDPALEYGKLLARVQAGDQKVDFRRLRMTYMDSWQRRQKVDTTAAKKQMMIDLFAKSFDSAIKNANVVLDHDFVDIDGQYVAYLAHRELAKAAGSNEAARKFHLQKEEFHKFVMKGLLKSITDSGKGVDRQTAFVVISPDEEHMLLLFLNLQAVKQSVEIGDGHTIDVVQVKDPETSKNTIVYFNLDVPARYDPQLIAKPSTPGASQEAPANAAAAAAEAAPGATDAASVPPASPNAETPISAPETQAPTSETPPPSQPSTPPASPPAP